jgi:hypothetical protein
MQTGLQMFSEDVCPVSDELLGALYRSSQHGLSELVTSVGSETRALLALYCYRRAHLQDIGIAIAATCSEADLAWLGGAGAALLSRSRNAPPKSALGRGWRRAVTLAGPSPEVAN